MTLPYTVHLVPKSHSDPTTWSDYIIGSKNIRLQMLQAAPEAFSSTYAREAAFSDTDWESRLQHPLAFTFAAIGKPNTASEGDMLPQANTKKWVGCIVLWGPIHDVNDNKDNPKEDSLVPIFEIYSFFVSPEARPYHLGTALLETSIAHARNLAAVQGSKQFVFRIEVLKGNEKVLGVYTRLGFAEVDAEEHGKAGRNTIVLLKRWDI